MNLLGAGYSEMEIHLAVRPVRDAAPPLLPPRTGAEWAAHFRRSLARPRTIPWHLGPGVTPAELAPVVRSLQAWQLGQTSDGRHLRAAVARFGDPDYQAAVDLFIKEEQGHGAMLGRFLDLAGAGRITADWGDTLFRAVRFCLRDPEAGTTQVVMLESLALVYFNAVRRATRSVVLAAVCRRILADEVSHARFHCERLAALYRRRSGAAFRARVAAQRAAFAGVAGLVWAGHRRALRAGGFDWRHFRRAAWDRMEEAWRLMDPAGYDWAAGGGPIPDAGISVPHLVRAAVAAAARPGAALTAG